MECAIYAKLHPKILPLPVRAILRIVLCWKNDKITKKVWDEFNSLTFPNIYEGESQEARDHALMTKAVMEYGNLKDLDPDWMKELFGKVSHFYTAIYSLETDRIVVECKFIYFDNRIWQTAWCIFPSRGRSVQPQLRP